MRLHHRRHSRRFPLPRVRHANRRKPRFPPPSSPLGATHSPGSHPLHHHHHAAHLHPQEILPLHHPPRRTPRLQRLRPLELLAHQPHRRRCHLHPRKLG